MLARTLDAQEVRKPVEVLFNVNALAVAASGTGLYVSLTRSQSGGHCCSKGCIRLEASAAVSRLVQAGNTLRHCCVLCVPTSSESVEWARQPAERLLWVGFPRAVPLRVRCAPRVLWYVAVRSQCRCFHHKRGITTARGGRGGGRGRGIYLCRPAPCSRLLAAFARVRLPPRLTPVTSNLNAPLCHRPSTNDHQHHFFQGTASPRIGESRGIEARPGTARPRGARPRTAVPGRRRKGACRAGLSPVIARSARGMEVLEVASDQSRGIGEERGIGSAVAVLQSLA